ncbi:hypothetical protein [Candidatus Midichloria mitochondrii]|uniref:hypothetical protein n=1 Tax=Candidatus Midichloria mitochondrii TaxID=234827 RepID=UPI00031C9F65|nr:hypothetical protein [Candidatus Midichloria mitochondrii]
MEGSLYPLSVVDVNCDGNPDALTANIDNNSVSVLLGNGGRTFKSAVSYGVGSPGGPGRYNNSKLGVHPQFLYYLGYGDGTFAAKQNHEVGDYPGVVFIADVNNDGSKMY